jgi:hypothetical protein
VTNLRVRLWPRGGQGNSRRMFCTPRNVGLTGAPGPQQSPQWGQVVVH